MHNECVPLGRHRQGQEVRYRVLLRAREVERQMKPYSSSQMWMPMVITWSASNTTVSGLTSRDTDWLVLACGLSVRSFKSYPGDSNIQPILRSTLLKEDMKDLGFLILKWALHKEVNLNVNSNKILAHNITLCQRLVRRYKKVIAIIY